MNTSTHYTIKQFDPSRPHKKKKKRRRKETVKVSPRLPSTPSNHSSLPSNVLHLQGIHNTCSKHKIIQYLRNHVWHSWHLWPCNLPKTQNKFILIIIWSVDNKTQHSARVHSRTSTHIEGRGKMYYNAAGKEWQTVHGMNFSVRFITRRQNMPVWQNVQAELRNMTRGDKTQEKGPSLTFLAPVRLGGAREAYRKCSRIRGRSNR